MNNKLKTYFFRIVKIYKLFVFLAVIFSNEVFSQIELSGNDIYRVFRSFEEASEVITDSVHVLDLGNHNLKEFPVEVLIYKNLYSLSFSDHNIDYYYRYRPNFLTEEDKKIVLEGRKKYGYGSRLENIYPFRNRNSFSDVPKEIGKLKLLEYLSFNEGVLTKWQLRRLHRKLPHCYINLETYYDDPPN